MKLGSGESVDPTCRHFCGWKSSWSSITGGHGGGGDITASDQRLTPMNLTDEGVTVAFTDDQQKIPETAPRTRGASSWS